MQWHPDQLLAVRPLRCRRGWPDHDVHPIRARRSAPRSSRTHRPARLTAPCPWPRTDRLRERLEPAGLRLHGGDDGGGITHGPRRPGSSCHHHRARVGFQRAPAEPSSVSTVDELAGLNARSRSCAVGSARLTAALRRSGDVPRSASPQLEWLTVGCPVRAIIERSCVM